MYRKTICISLYVLLFSIESFASDKPIHATIRTVKAAAIDEKQIILDYVVPLVNDQYEIIYDNNHIKVVYL